MLYMRNKDTGEIQEVPADSPEFIVLKNQVGSNGRSLWEQTGDHHVGALSERAEQGALREEDLGLLDQKQVQTVRADVSNVQKDHEPWRELTAAEIEAGITKEDKEAELRGEADAGKAEANEVLFAAAAERIGSTAEEFPVDAPRGAVVREEPSADVTEIADGNGSSGGGDSDDDGETVESLREQLRERGLPVSGNKAELQQRLAEDDQSDNDDEGDER